MNTNIVMLVYNRPIHTQQAIESLYSNTAHDLFNLTIVNDHSDKETRDLLRNLQEQHHFLIINRSETHGPGDCRNLACNLMQKRSKYLYFSDNDVYFKKDWLTKLIEVYEVVSKERVALLGGSCHAYLQDKPEHPPLLAGDFKVGIKDAVSGYSHLMTWEIWDRFGKFDTQEGLKKKTGRSDDWQYCQRIRLAGLLVGSVLPELVINTGLHDSYGDLAVGPETFKEVEGVKVL